MNPQGWTPVTRTSRVRRATGPNQSQEKTTAEQPRDSVEVKSSPPKKSEGPVWNVAPKRTSTVKKREFLALSGNNLPPGDPLLAGALVPGITEETETEVENATNRTDNTAIEGKSEKPDSPKAIAEIGEKPDAIEVKTSWGAKVLPRRDEKATVIVSRKLATLADVFPESVRDSLDALASDIKKNIGLEKKKSLEDGYIDEIHKVLGTKGSVGFFEVLNSDHKLYVALRLLRQMPSIPEGMEPAIRGGSQTIREFCAMQRNLEIEHPTWLGFYRMCIRDMNQEGKLRLDAVIDKTLAILESNQESSQANIIDAIKAAVIEEFKLDAVKDDFGAIPDWQLACVAKLAIDADCKKLRDALENDKSTPDTRSQAMHVFLRSNGNAYGLLLRRAYQDTPDTIKGLLRDVPRGVSKYLSNILTRKFLQQLNFPKKKHGELTVEEATDLVKREEFVKKLTDEATPKLRNALNQVDVKQLPIEFCRRIADVMDTVDRQVSDLKEREQILNIVGSDIALRILGGTWATATAEQFSRSTDVDQERVERTLANAVNSAFLRCIETLPEECGWHAFLTKVRVRGQTAVA